MKNYVTTFDPFFDQLLFGKSLRNNKLMATDIIEREDEYELSIELPHIKKEEIKISLKEGNLTVSISRNKKEEVEKDFYLLKERNEENMSRTYYVGDNVKYEDISAHLDEGLLTLVIKKRKEENKEEQFINIL